MSVIYIKNMKMPQTCDECLSGFVKTIGCTKRTNFQDRDKMRHPECPLCEIGENRTNLEIIERNNAREMASFLNQVETEGKTYGTRGVNQWLDWLTQGVD